MSITTDIANKIKTFTAQELTTAFDAAKQKYGNAFSRRKLKERIPRDIGEYNKTKRLLKFLNGEGEKNDKSYKYRVLVELLLLPHPFIKTEFKSEDLIDLVIFICQFLIKPNHFSFDYDYSPPTPFTPEMIVWCMENSTDIESTSEVIFFFLLKEEEYSTIMDIIKAVAKIGADRAFFELLKQAMMLYTHRDDSELFQLSFGSEENSLFHLAVQYLKLSDNINNSSNLDKFSIRFRDEFRDRFRFNVGGFFRKYNNYINTPNRSGDTPLHLAVQNHNLKMINILIRHGANADQPNTSRKTPLCFALWNLPLLDAILNHPDYRPTKNIGFAIVAAVEMKAFNVLDKLLNKVKAVFLADPHFLDSIVIDDEENGLLHFVIQHEFYAIAHRLMEYGMNVNQSNKLGDTPLHLLAQCGSSQMVSVLVQLGANVNQPNELGNTPLHLAVQRGSSDMVRELIKLGANADQPNKLGYSPYYFAVSRKDTEMMALLKKRDANKHQPDKLGQSSTQIDLAEKTSDESTSIVNETKAVSSNNFVETNKKIGMSIEEESFPLREPIGWMIFRKPGVTRSDEKDNEFFDSEIYREVYGL